MLALVCADDLKHVAALLGVGGLTCKVVCCGDELPGRVAALRGCSKCARAVALNRLMVPAGGCQEVADNAQKLNRSSPSGSPKCVLSHAWDSWERSRTTKKRMGFLAMCASRLPQACRGLIAFLRHQPLLCGMLRGTGGSSSVKRQHCDWQALTCQRRGRKAIS